MKEVIVAFDIDGTIRCNCTDSCMHPNQRVVNGIEFFAHMKNTTVIAWSGGGKQYTEQIIRELGLDKWIKPSKCYSKINYVMQHGFPTIAIDDQQEFDQSFCSLIVREK